MPNWCYSTIKIHGTNKESVKKVHHALEKAKHETRMEGSFWEDVLKNMGINVGDTVSTRGSISFITDCIESTENPGEYVFTLESEDAWSPVIDGIIPPILDKLDIPPGEVLYCYLAEETGMGIYINTDETRTWFPEDYFVDGDICTDWDEYCGTEYLTHKQMVGIVNSLFHKDCTLSIDKVELVSLIEEELDKRDDFDAYFIVGILTGE